ncbi:MAG: thioredoxin family protein [Campylobacterales bacterium]|nr:thioredoxin family protein [Campylobacterales bacterium]
MKKIVLLVMLTLSLFGANVDEFAKEVGFERDYKTALAKAKDEKKLLMMVLGADYCPWCRKFERNTLSSKLVMPRIKEEFIVLVVDKKFDIETFPGDFQTQFTPRVFFIDPKTQKSVYDKTGYIKKKEFVKDLDKAQTLFKGE